MAATAASSSAAASGSRSRNNVASTHGNNNSSSNIATQNNSVRIPKRVPPVPASEVPSAVSKLFSQGLVPQVVVYLSSRPPEERRGNVFWQQGIDEALIKSAGRGDIDNVKICLALEANVLAVTPAAPRQPPTTALLQAAQYNRIELTDFLLDHGAHASPTISLHLKTLPVTKAGVRWELCPYLPHKVYCNALALALLHGHLTVAERLVSYYKARPAPAHRELWVPLVIAIWTDSPPFVQDLLDAGAFPIGSMPHDRYHRDADLCVTHLAAIRGHAPTMRVLTSRSATVALFPTMALADAHNRHWVGTALHSVVYAALRLSPVEAYAGSRVRKRVLRYARDKMGGLVSGGLVAVNERDELGWTPLHWCAVVGCLRPAAVALTPGVSRALLDECGADVNAKDEKGRTALHLLAEKSADERLWKTRDLVEAMGVLIDRGADCTARDVYGRRALDVFEHQRQGLEAVGLRAKYGVTALNIKLGRRVLRKHTPTEHRDAGEDSEDDGEGANDGARRSQQRDGGSRYTSGRDIGSASGGATLEAGAGGKGKQRVNLSIAEQQQQQQQDDDGDEGYYNPPWGYERQERAGAARRGGFRDEELEGMEYGRGRPAQWEAI